MPSNRLLHETSPYLLQHAHNPVDWYPWGAEAFDASRTQNKPIFLSVGYSACYWCHVMERQCFENEAIAAEMNRLFINIKVDREERPDVDQLYMLAVQIMSHQGGWPMSVFLTPDLKPFYGGTYFPPTDAYGRPGFPTLLRALDDAYRNRPGEVQNSAENLVGHLERLSEPRVPKQAITIDTDFVERLIDRSAGDYDSHFGGFGSAPKFPRQTLLELLLVSNSITPNEARMKMLRHTLDALDQGGIHDHLGGGFHRYSTDAQWLVPHFEIMLYDNAMLAWVYVEAFHQTGHAPYARVARGIFDFTLREMTSPAGAFYTAFDAEVDAMEGLSYLWTSQEIDALLGADAPLFKKVYGIDRGPNFADPHHGTGKPDKNILFLPKPFEAFATELGTTADALEARLAPLRQTLYTARRQRKQPMLDTKILTSWNALMIRAFAHAGRILKDPAYIAAGTKAAEFLLTHHRDARHQLLRTSRDGVAKETPACLDDYAFLARALLALRDADVAQDWAGHATALAATLREKFGDPERGGFFFTGKDATDLLVRQKTGTDSPLPSGSAIAALAHLELGQPEIAQQTLRVFAQHLADSAEGMSALLQTAARYLQTHKPIHIAPGPEKPDRPATPAEVAGHIVSVQGEWRSATEMRLHLEVQKDFHLNANPAASGLIPTRLGVPKEDAANIAAIEYPAGEERRFPFAENPIPVYHDQVTIVIRFKSPVQQNQQLRLALSYQACDDNACLPVVTQQLIIAPAASVEDRH